MKAYEFTTPKFSGDMQYEHTFDSELMILLFRTIMKLDKSKRKYTNETVSLNLGKFQQSDDANFVEGHFITARHGVRRTQIDVHSQEEVGTIESYHGVEYNVNFMIDRNTGLLLVQEDFNKVFSRKLLHTFLHLHKNLIYPYIDEFNKLNKSHPFIIHKRSCYRLQTLPPINFMDKLQEFQKVKSAVLTLDDTTDKSDVDVSETLDAELQNNEIEDYDMEIKIKNKTGRSMVKVFERYFESIIVQQKYDSYAIEGVLENGKTKKITPDTITRDFYAQVSHNSNGIPSIDDIFNRMIDIIKNENPLADKGGTPNITPVGENVNVKAEIEKKVSERNQDKAHQEQTV
ncbi:hypothetical protein KFZ58_15665 [Virgibacillus sp. NKC19-16]|nr:hypothetical protein KFZ58_15665 [Virgibacillus sp. NKC19-16]